MTNLNLALGKFLRSCLQEEVAAEVAEEELTQELWEGGKAPGAGVVAGVVGHQAGAEFLKQTDEI